MRDQATEDWIDGARRADIWAVLCRVAQGHGVKLKQGRHKGVGPCPACGGKDRFSIDLQKGLFYCRMSGTGGDAIALVSYVTGADFLGAVEWITGEAPPRGEQGKAPDPALIKAREEQRARDDAARAQSVIDHRQNEINRAAAIWAEGRPLAGTIAEAYLHKRRCAVPAGARLRFHGGLKYWSHSAAQGKWVTLHQGPALLARIDDSGHHFIGCHCTYLDLATRKGKAEIVDPETGELLDAKKVRGSQKGGHIHLGGDPLRASELIMGEGIETTLAVANELGAARETLAGTLFWAGVNLGNIGGPHQAMVTHPSLTRTDVKGRIRRLKVQGPEPRQNCDDPVLIFPASITRAVLLGDGDSDRFTTENHLKRCAARNARPGLVTSAAWPGEGVDFGDLAMELAA